MPSDDPPQAPFIDPEDRPPSSAPRGRGRARGKRSLLARLLPVMIVVVALGGFAGLVGYYYMAEGPNGAAPLIKADQQPFKIKPDNPGGMAVPDQDKEIYDRMGHDQSSVPPPNTERLLPPPETPLPRPAPAPNMPAPPPPANAVAAVPAPPLTGSTPGSTTAPPPVAAEPATPNATQNPANPNRGGPVLGAPQSPRSTTLAAAPPGAPAAASPPPPPKPAPAAPAAKAQTAAVAPRPAPTPPPQAAAGGPLLRAAIGSLRTEADAKREWERQRRLYPEALARIAPSYASVDLGSKGVYWRIYIGPAESNAAARERCAALKEKRVDCFVARP